MTARNLLHGLCFFLVVLTPVCVLAQNPATLAEYVYAVPPGWNATTYPDGIALMSPPSATNEICVVNLWPRRPAGANLLADAYNAFRDVFKAYQLANMTDRGTQMPQSVVHGVSGQGWEYVVVRKGIARPGSRDSRLAFAMVAKLNDRLAVISGLSRDPLISTCFGELVYDAWPRFFYSLRFKNWTPTDQTALMRQKLAGQWTIATASVADQMTFAGNGRFADASAVQRYSRISSTELLRTTEAFFGNGAYTLKENTITLTRDDRKNQPERGLFRVEEESKDDGRTWAEILYLLRISAVDGKDYEVRYQKK
jgi:hypothetical protein